MQSKDILIKAKNFFDICFHNISLSQDEFMSSVETKLQLIPNYNDKVIFVSEIIRLGKLFVSNSRANLAQLKQIELTKAEISNGEVKCIE